MNTILNQNNGRNWSAIHGDCALGMSDLPDNSVGFSIYSPPFVDLFVYSDSSADLGNCANEAQFFEQYSHVIRQKLRVLKPGRLTAVHCTDIPTRKGKHGYIGLRPFSDQIVAAHMDAGFILHSRVTIWRDPVTEMQRTKALGLLYKQLQKDSSMSRTGLPDYLLVFKKPGDNCEPIAQNSREVPVDLWQQWASPVWMDIRQTDVLNGRMARTEQDERHVCPLQIPLIERAIRLWSNPGDVVLSPFMGIGSEGYVSLKTGRKFIGFELKESYWRQACKYIGAASDEFSGGLFERMTA
jgi:DNA modification methylase